MHWDRGHPGKQDQLEPKDKDQSKTVKPPYPIDLDVQDIQVQEPRDSKISQNLKVRFPRLPHELQEVAQLLRSLAYSH
jgi:hypothetical protein